MYFSVGLIHSSPKVIPLLTRVAHDVIADCELIHMVDEGIARLIAENGEVTEPVSRRVCTYALSAAAAAEVVMLTSASFGRAIDAVRATVRIPVVRIDEAMAEKAVEFGSHIGVLSAAKTTLAPTVALLREQADARGKDVALETWLCEDAAAALNADDLEAYDCIVLGALDRLAGSDIIVLADVMMHRVVHAASERAGVPVLAGPQHGFEDLARKLDYFRR